MAVLSSLNYDSINSHISDYHGQLNPLPIGKKLILKSLMTRIYNNRPPKPKYVFIWAVAVALKYLKELPSNELSSLKELSQKLAMLLALAVACRSSEM